MGAIYAREKPTMVCGMYVCAYILISYVYVKENRDAITLQILGYNYRENSKKTGPSFIFWFLSFVHLQVPNG